MKNNRFLAILILLLIFTSIDLFAQKDSTLKVMSYNIWNGFDWGKDVSRKEKLIDWVKNQNADVIALQELCGYNKEKLNKDANAWGHQYSEILKTTGYPIGITSRYPIEVKERILDNLSHGAFHCKTGNIDYLIVHLHPASLEKRFQEAIILSKKLQEIAKENANYIILGDFNSAISFDADLYYQCNKRVYDYSVISTFLAIGMKDVAKNYTFSLLERGSYPTRIFETKKQRLEPYQSLNNFYRIDLTLVSPNLEKKCINAKIYNNNETAFLSDHYPIISEFKIDMTQ